MCYVVANLVGQKLAHSTKASTPEGAFMEYHNAAVVRAQYYRKEHGSSPNIHWGQSTGYTGAEEGGEEEVRERPNCDQCDWCVYLIHPADSVELTYQDQVIWIIT